MSQLLCPTEANRMAVRKYAFNNHHVNMVAKTKYNEKRTQIKSWLWIKNQMSGFKYEPHIDHYKDEIVDLGPRLPYVGLDALKWLVLSIIYI